MHKQEKDKKTKRAAAPAFDRSSDSVSSRTQSLRPVNSILEEEELAFPQPPPMLQEVVAPPAAPAISANRLRSLSTPGVKRSSPRKPPPPIPPSVFPAMARDPPPGFPARTRRRQANRESIDLDDIMAGPDREEVSPVTPVVKSPVSRSTRELMDFLAQGPPNDFTRPGGELGGPLNPSHHNTNSISFESKPKGDRLRRMISLLNIGSGEKSRASAYTSKTLQKIRPFPPAVNPIPPRLANQTSLDGLSSLANRPVPPRPSRQPDPPSDHEISPPPSPCLPGTIRSSSLNATSPNRPPSPALVPPRRTSREKDSHLNGSANGHTYHQTKHTAELTTSDAAAATDITSPATTALTISLQNRKARTASVMNSPIQSGPTVGLSPSDVCHLHRLISSATSADECRLILDMFITKHGLPIEPPNTSSNSNNPEPSEDERLERSVVGFFLGGDPLEYGARVIPSPNGILLSGPTDSNDAETKSPSSLPPLPSPSEDSDDN